MEPLQGICTACQRVVPARYVTEHGQRILVARQHTLHETGGPICEGEDLAVEPLTPQEPHVDLMGDYI